MPRIIGAGAANIRAELFGGFQMTFGTRGRREPEDRRRVEYHGHSVRNHRFFGIVTRSAEALHQSRDRVRHPVRKMTPGITERDACQHRREHHALARFVVVSVVHGARNVLAENRERADAADVTVRICALRKRTRNAFGDTRTMRIRHRRI